MFRSEANHLLFTGSTGDDVLPVTAALHNLITKQGYKDIILDFNKVEFVDNSFVFPLVTTARFHRAENVDFELILPEDPKLANLFRNANWAHLISPERFDPRDERNKEHLSAIQFTDADDHFKAVDRSMDLLLRTLKGLDRSRLKALEWSLNEITDNVLNHSESPVGGGSFRSRPFQESIASSSTSVTQALGYPEVYDKDVPIYAMMRAQCAQPWKKASRGTDRPIRATVFLEHSNAAR